MHDPERLDRARRFYAAVVKRAADVQAPSIEAAFAAVPRERFLGPGPWWMGVGNPGHGYLATPDDDPAWLCQDFPVALDRERGIHNGLPSLHARCLERLAVQPGERVVHVGAGTGYYTAILAELAGLAGRVDAYEIDPALAELARSNLANWPAVRLHAADGDSEALWEVDAIYVNASATRPARTWLRALRPGGRLLFPLTPTDAGGAMLLITRIPEGFAARAVMGARFIAAQGLQDQEESAALTHAYAQGWPREVRSLRLDTEPDETCWMAGAGWWLSTASVT